MRETSKTRNKKVIVCSPSAPAIRRQIGLGGDVGLFARVTQRSNPNPLARGIRIRAVTSSAANTSADRHIAMDNSAYVPPFSHQYR